MPISTGDNTCRSTLIADPLFSYQGLPLPVLVQLGELIQYSQPKAVTSVSVCLCVNHGGTNNNRCS